MRFQRFCMMAVCVGTALSSMAQQSAGEQRKATATTTKARDAQTTSTFHDEKLTTGLLTAGKIAGVKFRGDVHYLDEGRAEKLDVYLPEKDGGAPRPVMVMIHGGGWQGGDKAAKRELQAGTTFARAGYVAVSVEYKKGEGCWPTNLQDCKNAVRWVRTHAKELNADPNNIGVMGGSAGGHLALMVAYTGGNPELAPPTPYPGVDDSVHAVLNLYGITNLRTRQKTDKTGKPNGQPRSGGVLVKGKPEDNPELWALVSPVSHITSATVPTLTLHGTADTAVDRYQPRELHQKLEAAGVENELVMIPGAPHSFLFHDKRLKEDLRPRVLKFFDKHLRD